jgi:CTP:phosphocholine cytidylyltransferase-like protein
MVEKSFVSVCTRTIPERNLIQVSEEVMYKNITVPVGYISDGLTKLINKYAPNCIRAALVHDYICSTGCLTRKTGDKYFEEILKLDGVGWFKRKRMYWAVRSYAIVTFKK